jgi:glycosyltransferase involved in cell wall biosynthesis
MKEHFKYIVITPVRDEEGYIGKTIESMTSQTIRPAEWIIVNDGSSDRTGTIAENAAQHNAWIHVVHRTNRGFRKSGGGVIEAFYDGYRVINGQGWEFIVKLDGDLSFRPEYFEACFTKFKEEPRLGLGGGMVCAREHGELKEESVGDPPFHVRGATKIYRRACWEQISPLVKAPGWDTIDEVKANMHGWRTRTFRDILLLQHKPTGSADGVWRTWFKNGVANYVTGYHPLFVLGKAIKRSFEKPIGFVSIALLAGFLSGYVKNMKQTSDKRTIRYLRKEQVRKLLLKKSIYG